MVTSAPSRMRFGPYRLRRKRKSVMFMGDFTRERAYKHSHKWTLTAPRQGRVPVPPSIALTLEKLWPTFRGPYASEALATAEHIAQAQLALSTLERAWEELTRGQEEALEVELTTHAHWKYARSRRTLALGDDLHAPTAPLQEVRYFDARRRLEENPSRLSRSLRGARQAASAPGRRGENPREAYERAKRTPDIEPVRPHLFRELEPFTTPLQERWRAAHGLRTAAVKQAEVIYWHGAQAHRQKLEQELSVDVAQASGALARLQRDFSLPAPEALEDAQRSVTLEAEAQAHGFKVWLRSLLR